MGKKENIEVLLTASLNAGSIEEVRREARELEAFLFTVSGSNSKAAHVIDQVDDSFLRSTVSKDTLENWTESSLARCFPNADPGIVKKAAASVKMITMTTDKHTDLVFDLRFPDPKTRRIDAVFIYGKKKQGQQFDVIIGHHGETHCLVDAHIVYNQQNSYARVDQFKKYLAL